MTGVTRNPGEVRDTGRAEAAAAAVTDLFRAHHLDLVRARECRGQMWGTAAW